MADRGLAYVTPAPDAVMPVDALTGRDARWVQRVIGVAYTSDHPYQMGALAVRGGKVIGLAVNKMRNDPRIVMDWADCSFHAEVSLVSTTDVTGSIVYVARVIGNRERIALAKPCISCLRLLSEAGARRAVWTLGENMVGMMNLG